MELYFEKGTLTQDDIRSGLKIGVSRRAVMPVFCGSCLLYTSIQIISYNSYL